MSRNSRSIIESGDRFFFNGLKGDDYTGEQRIIAVTNITVAGMLEYTIQLEGMEPSAGLHQIFYGDAMLLLQENIWCFEVDA